MMSSEQVDSGKGDIADIIALQLRKPKNWNWQLSTSKSSPHILLPIIKLYDYKGNLLIETHDTGPVCKRRSWHVEISPEKKQWESSRDSEFPTFYSGRSCSDNGVVTITNKSEESISRLERRRLNKNDYDFVKSAARDAGVIDGNTSSQPRNSEAKRKGVPLLQTHYHRRTRSDDAFERKLKHNENSELWSRNGAIKSETSTCKNSYKESVSEIFSKNASTANRLEESFSERGSILFPEKTNISKTIEPAKPTRYKTRTSIAGTLLISEESFYKPSRRKRSQRRTAPADMTSAEFKKESDRISSGIGTDSKSTEGCLQDEENKRQNAYRRRSTLSSSTSASYRISFPPTDDDKTPEKTEEIFISHLKQRSDPLHYAIDLKPDDKLEKLSKSWKNQRQIPRQRQFGNVENNEDEGSVIPEKSSNQQQYRKKRRKKTRCQRPHSDESTFSIADDVNWRDRDGVETSAAQACVKRKQTSSSPTSNSLFGSDLEGSGASAADFLDFVRQLSTQAERHVTAMGANVSRHSSKGLSGRRSQSSGSICNGKGRHEGKSCGSLPSYLDEGNSHGCNNIQDCENGQNNEVARIPPLGDGAPLHWKFSDTQTALCDQGYGSERSPEEEYPPPLPEHDNQYHEHYHLEPHACYPFITPESTFLVKLNKGSRGLGLSVTGGIDSGGSWPGLIRIKRLFPHQPASQCGLINVGDLLLEANGITLTGLTNYEALEVLRTASNQVELRICRPPPDVLTCVSPISEVPPPPPRREAAGGSYTPPLGYSSPEDDYYRGEFEIIIQKIQGSLGFTLRKEDDSALGHYVRALVREPALTDGRIKAGDKIIAVNDVEISPMTHEQAVQFLRQCGEEVKLRLYRDAAQTPVAALSPTETTPRTSFSRKSNLRQEAVDMLNDIAVRKLIPGNQDTYRRSLSPSASPRRLRRQPYPSDASQDTDHSSTKYPAQKDNDQFHEGLLHYAHPFSDDTFLFICDSSDDCDKPSRPSSLDLYNPNQTPVVARKPRFNFSLAHNAYELNNLDAEVLDAPNLTYNLGHDEGKGPDQGRPNDSFGQGPASMPHIPQENSSAGFSYKNPAYQTAHPPCVTDHEEHPQVPSKLAPVKQHFEGDSTIRKWKGSTLEEVEEPKEKTADFIKLREENEILAIELNRGWNSRLGFSLQGAAGVTYVSAVYANSVAARDGRLKPGDRVIRVNDESVEHMSTTEIIDLLRIVRGPVCIVVSRTNSKEDCLKSNAVN